MLVVYLVFTEGYAATSGKIWIRRQLCDEAIRLGRLLCELIPRNPELRALLALMLLHDSRRMARASPDEEIVTLEEQDRELWDRREIAEGVPLLEAALREGARGEYALQAAIAALHARAQRAEDTDWAQIARLYDALLQQRPSPVVELNRAAAIAMAEGPASGLALIDALESRRRAGRISFAAGRASGSVAARGPLERGGGSLPAGAGLGCERTGAALSDAPFGGSGRATIGKWNTARPTHYRLNRCGRKIGRRCARFTWKASPPEMRPSSRPRRSGKSGTRVIWSARGMVARSESGEVLGWAALSGVSSRCVYAGVAEVSVYVAGAARGRGVGRKLLARLIADSEAQGIWTLQAGIFPENVASIALHERAGFRIVGRRERLGQMNGRWRDVVLMERRSTTVGL